VSQIDAHELTNSIDQTNCEVSNRFDFKGTNSRVEISEAVLALVALSEFQIKQIIDIMKTKISKRDIDVDCLDHEEVIESGKEVRQ